MENLLLIADSYKVSHHKQYPPGTTVVHSYFESRGGVFSETVCFGLQYILKKYMSGVVVTEEKIAEAKELYSTHFGNDSIFNEEGWRYIIQVHGGKLPLVIKAVAEGTVVPVKNVLFTVENTDPKCFWLTNWFETILVQYWYPMTVATSSREQKKVIGKYLKHTSDDMSSLSFKLHDFGFRGVSSVESACLGGAAHLVNFQGTDTIAGIQMLRKFYHCPMGGHSIPAAEHSTVTSWGRGGEEAAFRNMLTQFPTGAVAVVSDSFNIWEACSKLWGGKLKDMIEHRAGTLVVRPDSGEPAVVVVKCLELLGRAFGTTVNSKGFKVLPPCIRLIQGDGVCLESLYEILGHLVKFGWSSENVAFGSGGALLQKLNRDTQKCAYKCSFAIVDGEPREVFKDPITDQGKKSKKGRLSLQNIDSSWTTVQTMEPIDETLNQLKTVFLNGDLIIDETFDTIRQRAEIGSYEDVVPMAECSLGPNNTPCELCDHDKFEAWKAEFLA